MNELQTNVVQWAKTRGLLDNVTKERIEKQTLKVIEEVGETAGAYIKGNVDEFHDGLGDVAVTLIILAAMKEVEIVDFDFTRRYKMPLLVITECIGFFESKQPSLYISNAYRHLQLFAEENGTTLDHCLELAYNVISKRTGKMVGNTFIKD